MRKEEWGLALAEVGLVAELGLVLDMWEAEVAEQGVVEGSVPELDLGI